MSLFPYDMSLWLYFLRHAQKQRSPSTSGVSAGEEFKVEYRAFSGRPWQVFVEHDIGIGGVVIHPCGKCGPAGSLERITDPGMLFHPAAKIQYGGFPGSEIDKRVSFQYQQDIQVIRQLPVHLVCTDIRSHIGGINQEYHSRKHPVCVCQFLIVVADYLKPVQIAVTPVVRLAYLVIKIQSFKFLHVLCVFSGNSREVERVR